VTQARESKRSERFMHIQQISVFLENRKGRLAEMTQLLAESQINIRAVSLADMTDLGVLRLIVNDPKRCLGVLKANDFAAQATEVVAVEVPDRPGALHHVLEILNANGLNVEYMYASVGKVDTGVVIFKVDPVDEAVAVLRRNGITVLPGEEAPMP
jgi:hypothetical protein